MHVSCQLTCGKAEKKIHLKRKEVVSQVATKKRGEEKENHTCDLMCESNLSYLTYRLASSHLSRVAGIYELLHSCKS